MNGKVATTQFGAKGVQAKAVQRRSAVVKATPYDEELVKTAVSRISPRLLELLPCMQGMWLSC